MRFTCLFSSHRFRPLTTAAIVLTLLGTAWADPKFKVLHDFPSFSGDGGGLYDPLTLDSAGNLYGVTAGGGTGWNGVGGGIAFELSPSRGKWTETVLYNFCTQGGNKCTDGYHPFGPLILGPAGNLYGAAAEGGSNGDGVFFELTPGSESWSYNVLYDNAFSYFVRGLTGDFYGLSGAGSYYNGAIAELSPGSDDWVRTELYSFTPQESSPENPLIFDRVGNLYGVTYYGGDVFKLSPPPSTSTADEWNFHLLHHFPAFSGDGWDCYAGLVFDKAGNLYGATQAGGTPNKTWCSGGCGIIYKLTPNGHGKWKETILHRFSKFEDGLDPMGTLTLDEQGNIYGTTVGGGGGAKVCLGGCGAVFKMTPTKSGKWTYTVLHRFSGNDGVGPQAGVILDGKGNIYGTTYQGGSHYYGVVFEITP